MAKFMVKKSELKNICKAVDDRKLAELKKEIIEILKKQDEKEFKKAVDYLESQELHFTHLEKSFTGKWVKKAGYGIGTVRIWKGKKYKKIAPNKWARVFDKEGRGTNIAIGKLIARVNKIDNVEDLMAFVMANKQRFVDENGMDLPVLDKLRAAVDARNNGNVGSKGTSKPAEKKSEPKKALKEKSDEELERNIKYLQREAKFDNSMRVSIAGSEKMPIKDAIKMLKDTLKERKTGKPAEKGTNDSIDEKKKKLEKLNDRLSELKTKDAKLTSQNRGNWGDGMRLSKLPSNKEWEENREKIAGVEAKIKILEKEIEEEENKPYWIQDSKGNRLTNEDAKERIENNLKRLNELKINYEPRKDMKIRDLENENKYLIERLNDNDKKEIHITEKFYESESEAEETPKAKHSNVKVFADKSSVGTFTKVDENTVEMPATKEMVALFDSLKKSVSKDDTRPFMTDCYYDGENIISTDGRRLTCIKAGEIGIEPGFVKVNTDGGKIKLEKFEKDFGDSRVKEFPNYKRVMPENNTQKVQLNQKVLKEKLKTMKKEGAWGTKKNFDVAFEFKDGKVMLDGVQVGTADGVKFDSDDQILRMNGEQLFDAMGTADNVTMFVSDNPIKPISLSDSVSDIVMMPMIVDGSSVPDYEARRAEKAGAKAEKEKKERDYKVANKKRIEDSMSRTNVDEVVDKRASEVDEWLKKDDEFLERTYEQMNYNLDRDLGRKEFLSVGDNVGKGRKFTVMSVYMHNKLAEKHPEVKEKLEAEMEKRGISVKKSLFDGFLLENLIEEDIDDTEEDEEERSLWNDYSAEQPELFNSTEFKVREAMNRCKVL